MSTDQILKSIELLKATNEAQSKLIDSMLTELSTPKPERKRRNLKQERVTEYAVLYAAGKFTKKIKPTS